MKTTIKFLPFLLLIQLAFANTGKYRLIITSDPSTSITIAWDQVSGSDPMVYYDTQDHGTNHALYANTKSVDRAIEYRGMDNRFARLTGLTPDTSYYFLIRDSEGNSDRYWFRTAPNDLSRLSFIAGGDSRNNRSPRQNANLLVSKLKPHAVFFGGDMTDDDTDSQWVDWFDDWQLTIASDGRIFPIIPARGNHEGASTIYNLFDTPDSNSYYALTFGNNLIRTYTLNTEISVSGNQLTWLENDLENTNTVFKMAQYHKPMRPHTSGKSEGNAEYSAWANVFYQERVRLVIDSDSHTVKTTWPIQPSSADGNDEGFIRNDTNGTVYAGEGCWGAPLRTNDDDKSWTRDSGSFNQLKLIFIDQNKIELRTIKTDNAASVGEVTNMDPFTLPNNLDIWTPSGGSVVEILPAASNSIPKIEFAQGNVMNNEQGDNISLDINVLEDAENIQKVDFYVDDVLTHSDVTSPYSFTHTYNDGSHTVKAVAENNSSDTGETRIFVNIGSFTVTSEELRIDDGNNDVEETETGVVYFDSSDLEMGYDGFDFVSGTPNGFQKIGLRFERLNIPQNASISNAYIQFRSDETDSDDAFYDIFIEDSGDAVPFEDDFTNNVSQRTKTGTSISWTPEAWIDTNLTGSAQQTPDLKSLLQEVINRSDWIQGNSIVFMIEPKGASLTNEDAKRVADSRDGTSSAPPTLVYSYSFDAATLSTEEFNNYFNITIYPNPYQNTFAIQVPELETDQLTLEICDVKGKKLYNQIIRTGEREVIEPGIDASGLYFLRIYSKDKRTVVTKKILKF